MKKIFIILLLPLLCCKSIFAQDSGTGDDLSSFVLTSVFPDVSDGLTQNQVTALEGKVTEILTANGVSSSSLDQPFVVYPRFIINSNTATQGGMRSIKMANCTFSLYIKEIHSNIIFSTYTKTITGTGMTDELAATNAVQQVNANDPGLQKFIETGKKKIVDYFNANCSKILAKVEADRKVKNYESALASLLSVPQEAKQCYTQVQAKINQVFDEVQKQRCAEYIQQGRSYAIQKDYAKAMDAMRNIDPTGPCKEEAKTLMTSWKKDVEDEQKILIDYNLKKYQGVVDVAKARAEAMSHIVAAWVLNQPHTHTIRYAELLR